MAMTQNMMNDLTTLGKVPTKALDSLTRKLNLCIGSAIHDAVANKESSAKLDIGIGTLCVNVQEMQVKFVPSKELKAVIKKSVEEKTDPLEIALEEAVIAKLCAICDEEI